MKEIFYNAHQDDQQNRDAKTGWEEACHRAQASRLEGKAGA